MPRDGSDAPAGAPDPSSWDRRKWFILAAICVAQFMVVLDIAVVNVALPSIRSDLHFTNESLQWVVSAYAILFGGFLLLGGRLSDVIGRRRVFMGGLAIFTIASLLCGFAWSEASLITFRAIQGMGGALLSPAALSILVTTFAEGRERNLALGVWGGIAGSGAAAGTLLGGLLTSGLGWQWIFYINVPIGAALIALSPLLLPAAPGRFVRRGFDFPGATTATAGLMVLVYALTRATQIGWSTGETIGLLSAAAVLLIAFHVIEFRSRAPVLPLRVLRLPTPRAANIVGFLVGAALFSQFFLLSLYMQQVLGYSALKTGVAYVATTVTSVIFAVVAQALVTRLGNRVVLPIGMALLTAALLLYTRLPVTGSYTRDLLPGFVLSGIGLGLAFVPVSIASLTGVRPAEAGAASGLINTSQQIGGAVGLAAMTTIATTATNSYVRHHLTQGVVGPAGLTHGFKIAFWALAGLTAAAGVLAAALIGGRTAGEAAAVAPDESPAEPGRRREPAFAPAPQPVRVLSLVGTLPDGSQNRVLLQAARELAPPGMAIDEFDLGTLPVFDPDFASGPHGEPTSVTRLRHAISEAEAMLVVTPEDDHGAAVSLRNALDWAAGSYAGSPLAGKAVAVMGGSSGGDTPTTQAQLHAALELRGATVLAEPRVFVRRVHERVDTDGRVTDEHVRQAVGTLLVALFETARPSRQAA